MSGTMSTMEAGSTYKVSMKVSLADGSKYAVRGLGVFFYDEGVGTDTSHQHELFCNAQADFTTYGFLTDSTNWTTLADTIVADSAYKNFIIGFFKDSTSNVTVVQPGNLWNSYYYIDDVSIEKINTTSVASLHTIPGTQLSPNPLSNNAILEFANPHNRQHSFSIYDMQGTCVMKIDNVKQGEKINRNNLASGCYFYELKSEDGSVAKGKLMVQ